MNTTPVEPETSLRSVFFQAFFVRLLLSRPLPVASGFVLLFVLTGLSWFGNREPASPSTSASPLSAQNRTPLLGKLGTLYQQMGKQSLQEAMQIDLHFITHPGTIHQAASLACRLPHEPERLLPLGTIIVEIYDQAHQELLIFGKPGAGKSTMLIKLAAHLVKQAKQNEMERIPVLLPLSTWAEKRLPLQNWIIEVDPATSRRCAAINDQAD